MKSFIPLAVCRDGNYVTAHSEARRRLAPYQQDGILYFLIERQGETFGATRNMQFASRRQDALWDELCEKYKGGAE